MQTPKNVADKQLESIRFKILNSYLETIKNSFEQNRSQFKLINYGTGSGKTHQLFQAICKTIQEYSDIQIIGIYIAPLVAHLSVPNYVKNQYPDIPVYKLNSLEMKTTDEYIELYKKWIPKIIKNKNIWKINSHNISREQLDKVKQNFQQVPNIITRLKFVQEFDFGDKKIQDNQIKKTKQDITSRIEKFLVFLINSNLDESNWSDECLKLVELFFPLYLLRDKSGILMLTYAKFETKISYLKYNGEKWVKKNEHLDKYIANKANNSTKFIWAFDEQEDGYQIMLKEKIDIISPEEMAISNALSSVYREFALLFAKKNKLERELLNFLGNNRGSFDDFQEYLEKGKPLAPQLQQYIKPYQKITVKEGNSIEFLQYLIGINKGIEEALAEIAAIFSDSKEDSPVNLNFEMLSRILAKFKNTKTLLIPKSIYGNLSNDLMNIFCHNNLYIYNIEALQNLYLSKASGGHVHITDNKVSNKTSVAELIYTILILRFQVAKIKKILANVLDEEDSQSLVLDIWSRQISKIQKADEESTVSNEKSDYLDRKYVYESNKPIINIKEISRYQSSQNNLIAPELQEISIGSTAIFTSPEYKMISILENRNNIIFSISATGGIFGDLTTSYDMVYLKDKLSHQSGESLFKPMTESEISTCEEIRKYRQQRRTITVDFFSQNLEFFPNDKTQEIVSRFKELFLEDFICYLKEEQNISWLNKYKRQELFKFICFLFYLFEADDIQETIAFTQSLRWIKKLLEYCSSINHANFIFTKSEEHQNIYYVEIKHKKYQSNIQIKLIVYEASFNKNYSNQNIQKTYLDELVEEEKQKIFFISAYQSASKGLNPIIKNINGIEKDFDSLVLLMDSFYTVIQSLPKKSKDKKEVEELNKSTTLYHFTLMKSIVNIGDSYLAIKDFNQYLNTPEASKFRAEQHQILLGKGTLQAIGRSERRDFLNQVIKIFINNETRENLVRFYNYLRENEPNEIRKLSVNNYAVYLSVLEESKKRAIKNYDDHIYDEVDAEIAFQEFKTTMLEEIELFHQNKNTFDVKKAWDGLRDPIVFKNPTQYLENLRNLKLFPDEFIDSLFYYNREQPEFTPYLAWIEENRCNIISDDLNGDRPYTYQKRLYPQEIKVNSQGYDLEGNEIELLNASTKSIGRLYNDLIPQPEIFDTYIPRPSFFYDVLYPSLTENFVERWIKDVIFNGKDWKAIETSYGFKQWLDFEKYPQLYELFDLYYVRNNTLFCIDVKAWSRASGNRLSQETLTKTKKKLKRITTKYSEFTTVKGLLLNLWTKTKTPKPDKDKNFPLYSGNLIYFDPNNCPVESSVLRDFLLKNNK